MNSDLAESLHPPRLPEAFATLSAADLLAAFGLGLILAALILTLALPLLRRRPSRPGLKARLAGARALPEAERSLAFARILSETGTPLPEDLRQGLYSRDGADPARIEALIRGRGP